ncbi:hypothetical protein J7E81_15430 [Bacillus sp. ISL-18]|uniref:hypothetical protein n=1 Tax=Bacillus sp. ISL-18 TaxID=2819118 RepID=UPI001BE66909|nr:hypothetical protein [Bacillus sp. ISL-18]MBT2656610.1 hypothetical protein [Bacillus sp. ISL-18]
MRVFLSPQFNKTDKLAYEFIGDKIIVTLNGETDEFDFTNLPNGNIGGGHREDAIITTLPICPIQEAFKKDGIMNVTLLNFIGENPTKEECFPEWIEVG